MDRPTSYLEAQVRGIRAKDHAIFSDLSKLDQDVLMVHSNASRQLRSSQGPRGAHGHAADDFTLHQRLDAMKKTHQEEYCRLRDTHFAEKVHLEEEVHKLKKRLHLCQLELDSVSQNYREMQAYAQSGGGVRDIGMLEEVMKAKDVQMAKLAGQLREAERQVVELRRSLEEAIAAIRKQHKENAGLARKVELFSRTLPADEFSRKELLSEVEALKASRIALEREVWRVSSLAGAPPDADFTAALRCIERAVTLGSHTTTSTAAFHSSHHYTSRTPRGGDARDPRDGLSSPEKSRYMDPSTVTAQGVADFNESSFLSRGAGPMGDEAGSPTPPRAGAAGDAGSLAAELHDLQRKLRTLQRENDLKTNALTAEQQRVNSLEMHVISLEAQAQQQQPGPAPDAGTQEQQQTLMLKDHELKLANRRVEELERMVEGLSKELQDLRVELSVNEKTSVREATAAKEELERERARLRAAEATIAQLHSARDGSDNHARQLLTAERERADALEKTVSQLRAAAATAPETIAALQQQLVEAKAGLAAAQQALQQRADDAADARVMVLEDTVGKLKLDLTQRVQQVAALERQVQDAAPAAAAAALPPAPHAADLELTRKVSELERQVAESTAQLAAAVESRDREQAAAAGLRAELASAIAASAEARDATASLRHAQEVHASEMRELQGEVATYKAAAADVDALKLAAANAAETEAMLNKQVAALQQENDELAAALQTARTLAAEADTQRSDAHAQQQAQARETEALMNDQIANLQQENDTLTHTLRQERLKMGELEDKANDAQDAQRALALLQADLVAKTEEVAKLEAELTRAAEEKGGANDKDNTAAGDKSAALQREVDTANEMLTVKTALLAEAEAKLAELEATGGVGGDADLSAELDKERDLRKKDAMAHQVALAMKAEELETQKKLQASLKESFDGQVAMANELRRGLECAKNAASAAEKDLADERAKYLTLRRASSASPTQDDRSGSPGVSSEDSESLAALADQHHTLARYAQALTAQHRHRLVQLHAALSGTPSPPPSPPQAAASAPDNTKLVELERQLDEAKAQHTARIKDLKAQLMEANKDRTSLKRELTDLKRVHDAMKG